MELTTDITDFARRDIDLNGKTKPVLVTGNAGPAVIVIHEIYGFTPTMARFCRWVRDAGFRVYAPILFGEPNAGNAEKPSVARIASLCISREFAILFANKSSPVTDWLRALARLAHHSAAGRESAPSVCASQVDLRFRWPSSRSCWLRFSPNPAPPHCRLPHLISRLMI